AAPPRPSAATSVKARAAFLMVKPPTGLVEPAATGGRRTFHGHRGPPPDPDRRSADRASPRGPRLKSKGWTNAGKNCLLLKESSFLLLCQPGVSVMAAFPSLSTDQVAAFVELARQGSLHRAAGVLHITEQGIRNRLLALEGRLGVELYRKSRGPRRAQPLTEPGRQFLPHAVAFLDRARQLGELFGGAAGPHEIHIAATQYLILYVLIDAVRRFHQAFPHIRV